MMLNRYFTQCFAFSSLEHVMSSKRDLFSFFRLFAAFLVLYAHAYHIFGLGSDPITRVTGYYTGTLAVYVFFSISGFFIVRSAIERNFFQYCTARIVRIYPALIVCNILTVVLIIPLASDVNWLSFISSPESLAYIKINSILETLKFTITGVFVNNPDQAINGSLWTLPVEVRAYILALLLVMLVLTSKVSRFNAFLISVIFIHSKFPDIFTTLFPIPGSVTLLLYFLFGSALYINRKYIPVSPVLLILVLLAIVLYRHSLPAIVLAFLITYAVISSGYLLGKLVNLTLNHDYSYGFYLYAYPLSQLSYVFFADVKFSYYLIFIVLSTLVLSVFSWHIIEKPISMLARKYFFPKLKLFMYHITNA